MKTYHKLIIALLLPTIIAYQAFKINNTGIDFKNLILNLDLFTWSLTTPITIVIFFLLTIQLKHSLSIFLCKIPIISMFNVTLSNTLLNYLPAKAGTLTKGIYLKTKYKVPFFDYGLYLATTTAATSLTALIFIIAAVTTEYGLKTISTFSYILTIILIIAATAFAVARKKGFLIKKIPAGIKNHLHKKNIFIILSICIIIFIMGALRLYICFLCIDQKESLSNVIIIQGAVTLSFLISFTPGGIGIKEGALIFAATLLGMDTNVAVTVSILDRLSSLIPTIVVGIFSTRSLMVK